MHYSLRIVCGFFNVPQLFYNKGCETGPPAYSPYPRRLESLAICWCNYKGSTFYSVTLRPWVLVRRSRTHDLPHDSPMLNQLRNRNAMIREIRVLKQQTFLMDRQRRFRREIFYLSWTPVSPRTWQLIKVLGHCLKRKRDLNLRHAVFKGFSFNRSWPRTVVRLVHEKKNDRSDCLL